MKRLHITLSNIERYLKWILILSIFKSFGADSVQVIDKIIAYFARDGDIYSVNYPYHDVNKLYITTVLKTTDYG